jgi:hypothetical protein
MHNCANDILAFHNDKVTLIQSQRTAMRDRRNANRDRLKTRLKANEKPIPEKFIKQGSYAMLTMVQDPNNDYDIDDGVYYPQATLRDEDGNDMSPADLRQMVCDALQDERFNKQPEVKKTCVRIFYNEGYHVDMPIYRTRESDGEYELACGDEWVVSRAADVETWFYDTNCLKSPDENNGRQFRRDVRLLKKFARSREDWKEQIASGFTITKLAEECYMANKDREDKALRDTMRSIYDRLLNDLEVQHPVTPGAMLTAGPNDKGTKFLRDKLEQALKDLEVLDNPDCTRKDALAAWDKVYDTDFFSARYKEETEKATSTTNAGILSNLIATRKDPQAVDKRGGGRFA